MRMMLCSNQSKYVSGLLGHLPMLLLTHMMSFFVLSSGVLEHDVLLKNAPSRVSDVFHDHYDDSFTLAKSKKHGVRLAKYDANFDFKFKKQLESVTGSDLRIAVESIDGKNRADCLIVEEFVQTSLLSYTDDLQIQVGTEHVFPPTYKVLAKAAPKGLGHLLLVITTEGQPHYSQYYIIDPFSNRVVHSQDLDLFLPIQDPPNDSNGVVHSHDPDLFIPIQETESILVDETVEKVWLLGYQRSTLVIFEAKYKTGNEIILPSSLIEIHQFSYYPVDPFENCWTLSLQASQDRSNPDILTVVDHRKKLLVQYYFDHLDGTDKRHLKKTESISIGLKGCGLKDITGVRLHNNYLAVRKGNLITIYTIDSSKSHLETKEIMHREFNNDYAEGWVKSMEFSNGGKSLIGIFQMNGNHYGYRMSIPTESGS